jgi:putative spermidine/putrescine transport system ATP-binding protein
MSGHLEMRGIERSFGTSPVLDGVDLTVQAGQCAALLGPSGSGKSTLLRIVAGLDDASRGEVLLDGRRVDGDAPERRRTSLVFQRPRLFPHLDVLDNVAFPLAVSGERRRAARSSAGRFLDLVGLSALASRRPSTLSGGQEQRVALARALAARPLVLLLDEPFSALDPEVRDEMHALVHDLRAAVETTVLVVTHDRAEAAALADTVAVLLDGRIVAHDTIDALHTRPSCLALHEFLGGRNAVVGEVAAGRHLSALGALEVPWNTPDGRGTLVVRQEALRIAGQGESWDVAGVVTSSRPHGARHLVQLDCGGTPLALETHLGPSLLGVGTRTYVVVPPEARHVIPLARRTSRPTTAAAAVVAPRTED